MRIFYSFLLFVFCFSTSSSFGQRGIDGNKTINALNTIVNEYTTLTANAAAGATTITVAASGLNANSRFGAGNTLAPGDLIMIIQMQGATILGAPDAFTPTISNPNNATWGAVTNYNNCGKFEYCQVNAVPAGGTSIVVDCGLTNSYTAAGKVQVIRIPRYNTLLIQSPGVLSCQAWNGTTGGVLAVEVYGNTSITAGGKISTTGTGFRGGALFTTTGRTTTGLYSCVSLDVGTNKGESVAGYDTDYTPYGGKFCRAAAANGGGGGNVWNCGGGGGGNASLAAWTGQGNPNNTVAGWTTAWNLESASFSTSTSSGGGRGGYSFSSSNQNATTLGPGTIGVTNAWGGSYRYNLGGLGGRPLDYSTGRIYLGGGGGAGEQDNNQGGAGGAGGGIIYITSYGTITGSGNDSIISNGANGGSTNIAGFNAGKDAGGGAGAGGTILINSVGAVSGIFIKANGGIGGNQLQGTVGLGETEGPGGGGGGGYIGLTSGPAAGSQQALGGINGITQSPQLTEFTPNGATMGGAGLTNQAIIRVDTISAANATICSGNTATLTATINGAIVATINWYAAATGGTSIGTGSTFTTPVLATSTTYYVGFCPGTYRIPVVVTVNTSPTTSLAGPNQSVCATSATLAGNTPTAGTGTWTLVSGTGTITASTSPTSTVTGLGIGANVFQWTITNPPCGTSSTQVTITSTGGPSTANAGTAQTVCGTTATLAGNTATTGTGTWTLLSGAGTITTPSSATSGITGLGIGANVFQWSITSTPCPASTSTVAITGVAAPTTANAGTAQTVCGTTATLAGNTATTGTGTWTLLSGAGTITTPSSATSGITGLGIGANVFQWSITSTPCPASTSTVTITGVAAPTTANAGTAQTVCGTTATLAGNTVTTGTGTWTLISGAGTITTPSSATSGITGLGIGANVFQWSIANAPCVASTSTVTITGVAAPTTANAGTAQTVCGTTATLAGNTATTGTGTWTLLSGAGTITAPSSATSGITGLGIGANVFQWSITSTPCPASTSTVTITGVAAPTTANAGTAQTVCGITATLAGNTATTGTGTWTLISGAGTITTPSSATSGITGLGIGANVFQWSIANAPCVASTSTVTITGVATPTTANAGTAQTVCGTAATLAGNTATTGTGTWTLISGAGTITTPSSATSGITGLGIGANVFQWSIANAPCVASTSTVTITGLEAPSTANAGTAQTVCGTTATLAGNAATTGTGTWTLISGAGTITTPSSATSGITGLGIGANVFQWSIDNAPCVASTSTVTITATLLADATISSLTPLCIGSPAFNLNAVTAGGTWSGTGITSGASGTFDPSISGTGTFTITYTISGSCGNTDTALVTVTPNADATITPLSSFCVSASPINLSASTLGGTWSGTGLTNTSTGTFDPATAGIGAHIITYSISGTCGATDTVLITVNSSSDATIVQPATICSGAGLFNLVAATAGGTWTGPGITSAASGTFDPSIAGIGTHIITYSISGSCGATDTVSISVTSGANASIIAVSPICANATVFNLTAATAGGTWSGTGITDPINGTFDPSLANAGTNTITYTISGACGDTATQNITVNALPTPSFTSDVTAGCAPVCITFTEAASNTCNTMLFEFGDGNTSTSSTATNCYTNAGNYSVTITCTDLNNCSDTTTITNMISVSPSPIASFTASPSGALPVNSTVSFADISTNGGISVWNFGDAASGSNTSTLTSDSHVYSTEGIYCIVLISSNTAGCADTTSTCITIADEATLVIPTIFTPNGDLINDIFYFATSSVKELNCSVYDRWGLQIAEWTATNDSKAGWDGRTTSGTIASDGVYYFIMNAKTLNNKLIEKKGFIQLLNTK